MFISRIQWKRQSLMPNSMIDNYQAHQLIWKLFDEDRERKRDFLFRYEIFQGYPLIYTVSERKPIADHPQWQIDIKEYAPKLKLEQRLSFVMRVNPVCGKRSEDGKQSRHDIIMEAKTHLKAANIARAEWPQQAEIIQQEGIKWLEARAEKHGFRLSPTAVRVDGYQPLSFRKPNNGQLVRISTLEFTGELTVSEPALFLELLNHGLGPAKAFGCGLMMVRKI